MTRYNYLLLAIMFLAWLGMSAFFPYLVPMLRGHFAIESSEVGTIMGAGVIIGSTVSFLLSLKVSHRNEKSLLAISLICFSISVFSMLFPEAFGPKYIIVIWIGVFVTLYRFAAGIYFNSSRALQISALVDESARLRLLSHIKVVNSLAAGLGPLLGQLAINRAGDRGFLWPAGILFFAALLALSLSPSARMSPGPNIANHKNEEASNRGLSFYFICLGAMFHFIFEAQLYAYITMKLVQAGHQEWVGTLFTINAITLIAIGIIMTRFSDSMKGNIRLIIVGSSFSLTAVLLATQSFSYLSVALIGFLFSIGEFLTPQLTLDLMTQTGKRQLKNVAIYNYFTSAVGLSVGFYLGGVLAETSSTIPVVTAWSVVLAFIALFLTMAKRTSPVKI